MRLPGTKNAKDTAFFFRNAQALGLYAAKLSANGKDPDIVAVLFRDCDGTNSSSRSLWNEKFESMKNGFLAAGFDRGVPMLPKPKSEAWLLCAVKEQPYQRCCALENESGNDASPNSLKGQLAAALGKEPTAERLTELVKDGTVDPHRIDMPSFNAFKEALLQAIRA